MLTRSLLAALCACAVLSGSARAELLHNGNFEGGQYPWDCWSIQCNADGASHHSGQLGLHVQGRHENWQGPSQYINVQPGHTYQVSAYIKLLNGHNNQVDLEIGYDLSGGGNDYDSAASRSGVSPSNGWVHLSGTFTAPNHGIDKARFYFQVSDPSTNYYVDDATVTETGSGGGSSSHTGGGTSTHSGSGSVDSNIDRLRRSDINVHVTTAGGINRKDVSIRILQTKKSFPFGTAVAAQQYNQNAGNGKYRDFIHKHFNWAVPENALKWPSVEYARGQKNFQPALDMIHGLRSHGIKVRGHNLVWAVDQWVQNWVKGLHGDELRYEVKHHIEETMQKTHGLLEHWDVNNEMLHGDFFQHQLNDNNYNKEIFRIAHHADSHPKLFLNDYNVVSNGQSTNQYLAQARDFKNANVGLYGIGAQCHFGSEQYPDPNSIKQHLDTLAQAGLPIWATELDVMSHDENKRADFYESAMTALYGHHAVEGILLWGFWDQRHWRGEAAALVKGNNLDLTAAGRRVIDLLENRWMTDETHALSQDGTQFSTRGFHGDYQVRVMLHGNELSNLRQTFTLGSGAHTVNINVHH